MLTKLLRRKSQNIVEISRKYYVRVVKVLSLYIAQGEQNISPILWWWLSFNLSCQDMLQFWKENDPKVFFFVLCSSQNSFKGHLSNTVAMLSFHLVCQQESCWRKYLGFCNSENDIALRYFSSCCALCSSQISFKGHLSNPMAVLLSFNLVYQERRVKEKQLNAFCCKPLIVPLPLIFNSVIVLNFYSSSST